MSNNCLTNLFKERRDRLYIVVSGGFLEHNEMLVTLDELRSESGRDNSVVRQIALVSNEKEQSALIGLLDALEPVC